MILCNRVWRRGWATLLPRRSGTKYPESFNDRAPHTLSGGGALRCGTSCAQAVWQRLRSPEARFQIMVSLSIFDPE